MVRGKRMDNGQEYPHRYEEPPKEESPYDTVRLQVGYVIDGLEAADDLDLLMLLSRQIKATAQLAKELILREQMRSIPSKN